VKELVVISGKGGTGKTSLTASFAALAAPAVLADCDVDAADLHLVMAPVREQTHPFRCGHEAVIRLADCIGCGACLARCRFEAVRCLEGDGSGSGYGQGRSACDNCEVCARACPVRAADYLDAMRQAGLSTAEPRFVIDPTACEGCGVCVQACPVKAIDFPERVSGEWYVSTTRHGPMVHARLEPGGENSGKLVSRVRETARGIAGARGLGTILVDGPPGVGCAVIASLAGATQALIVTEPTLSGEHDMTRVLDLARHFGIAAAVCVNKWDINPGMTTRIEAAAQARGATLAGRLRYDPAVTAAQLQARAVVELPNAPIAADIRAVWAALDF
jgi:MinD superfamily P-loop ATPase